MIRRKLLTGLLGAPLIAKYGGQSPAPQNAPSGPPLQGIGVQPGATGILTARIVIVSGATGGIFIYSGTPALGNLVSSDVGTSSGFDTFGNEFLGPGLTSYLHLGGIIIAAQYAGSGIGFSFATSPGGPYNITGGLNTDNFGNGNISVSGQTFKFVSLADLNTYDIGRLSQVTNTSQTINSTSFTAIAPSSGPALSGGVAIGTYDLDVYLLYTAALSAGTPEFRISGTATATGNITGIASVTGVTAGSVLVPSVSSYGTTINGPSPMVATDTYFMWLTGSVTVTVAGTLQVQAATSAAVDTFTVNPGSRLRLYPV